MPLILSVRSIDRQPGATPPPLRLEGRGAVIGRAAEADWTLADERNTVSSRHCEIAFRDGAYLIADRSTNGTYVNGKRLTAPQRLADGDTIEVGPYRIGATVSADAPTAAPASQRAEGGAVDQLLRHAGLSRADVGGGDPEILAAAGALLRQMAGGTRGLLEARARARKELGAAPAAANPIEERGTAEQALAALLTPGGDRAVASAFADIDAHQRASLKAMQGAMKATLDRFAPAAIRARGGKDEAALWREYESAFTGERNPDQAFIEVFARELRAAYEALAARK